MVKFEKLENVNFEKLEYPEGNLYVVGDIHGCVKETEILLEGLQSKKNFSSKDQIIFIGDYIDRGPNSKGVIDLLINFRKSYPSTIFLRGNHEDMFLGFVGIGGMYGEFYPMNGGDKVFEEYGLSKYIHRSIDGSAYVRGITKEELQKNFPEDHINFIKDTKLAIETEHFIFVHAGLDPYATKEEQTNEDIMWIREPFLRNEHKFGKWVVHGHTPETNIYYNAPYEISIDTGCVFGDLYGKKLSCLLLNKDNPTESELIYVNALGDYY